MEYQEFTSTGIRTYTGGAVTDEVPMNTREPIPITGLMLRAQGNDAIVELEIGGKWYKIVACDMRGSFSHIVEPLGIRKCMIEGHVCTS